MESASAQSSPKKSTHEAIDEKPESPILPPQRQEQAQVEPADSLSLEKMEESQPTNTNNNTKSQGVSGGRTQVQTPEPQQHLSQTHMAERSPSTPGYLPPFDWEEFEARYEKALSDADAHEQELLEEFEVLIKYFNVWASAASVHDTERGVKRLQTRERYVKIAEQSLLQKKKHLTEVVRAFQSALALLSQS